VVPAKAIALVEASDQKAVLTRAGEIGWATRDYAGRIACLLPQQVSLEEVARSLSGTGVSSISLQPVSLEHAYLEVMHESPYRFAARRRQSPVELAVNA
jgi:ABC-2 type transport system ATP-binding protein